MTLSATHTRAASDAYDKWRLHYHDQILRAVYEVAMDQHRAITNMARFLRWYYEAESDVHADGSQTRSRSRSRGSSNGSSGRQTTRRKQRERTENSSDGKLL